MFFIYMMVGRPVQLAPSEPGDVILDVRKMSIASRLNRNNPVKDDSIQVRAGELVCIAGMDGNCGRRFCYGLGETASVCPSCRSRAMR